NYRNPILYADYSDPDVTRVGNDYYMTASSFNEAPGLPILHSKDMVNWKLVNYALPDVLPNENFSTPKRGDGVWAPSIRFHKGEFYI
ncbi:family 43 glycosylhydrolase, partial [Chryseobacterium sp. SIMBA_028]